ncbi:MAG: exopolysaccharide biosynthesis protein [Verrucomicrobiales bacterium]|nr:exopolysaccharide biosynthesis protein [Verrucomicrobiales bacterium]
MKRPRHNRRHRQGTHSPNGQKPPHLRFSEELQQLTQTFEGRPVQVGEILLATKGRGFHLLLVCIALPFVTPIPLPGFSIPFGVAVALIGGRMALGQKPWLPQRLLDYQLPPQFLGKLLASASRVVRWIEYLLRPRLTFMQERVVFRRVAGLLIAISGLYLIIPLPIPFSNSLPAWTVLLLAAGALERDGLFFVGGCVSFVLTTGYFILLATGASHLLAKFPNFWPF